jgi:hypothetical protein
MCKTKEGSREAALIQVLLVQVVLVSGTLASRRHAAAADMKGRFGTAPSAALLSRYLSLAAKRKRR